MSYETMSFVKEDGVAVMTLNRPEKLNAINPTMWFELARATEEAQNDEEVRVLVLTGTFVSDVLYVFVDPRVKYD